MNTRIHFLFIALMCLGVTLSMAQYVHVPVAGDFQAVATGAWSNTAIWETYDGATWAPAGAPPTGQGMGICIRGGNVVTVDADITIDSTFVDALGTLYVPSGVTLTVLNFLTATTTPVWSLASINLTVSGTVSVDGTLKSSTDDAATINGGTISIVGGSVAINSGGTFDMAHNGGTGSVSVPTCTWNDGSNLLISGITSATGVTGIGGQNIYNLILNSPNGSANCGLGMNQNPTTIRGDIVSMGNGMGRFQMSSIGAGTLTNRAQAVINIYGNIYQLQSMGATTTTSFTATGSSASYVDIIVNVYGNIVVDCGNFSITRGSMGGTGTCTWNLYGNFSLYDVVSGSGAITHSSVIVPYNAKWRFCKVGGIQELTLNPVATSAYGSSGIIFEIAPGATLKVISYPGFNGISFAGGTLDLNGHAFSYAGSLPILAYADQSTAQVTTDTEWPTTGIMPAQVVIKNPHGVTLNNNAKTITASAASTTAYLLRLCDGVLNTNGTTLNLGNATVGCAQLQGGVYIGYPVSSGLIASTSVLNGATNALKSWVNGPIQWTNILTSARTFVAPIGTSAWGRQVVVMFTQAAATATTYKVEAKNGAPTVVSLTGLEKVSPTRYFTLAKSAGAAISSCNLRMWYDDEGTEDGANLVVAKDTTGTSAWANFGGTNTYTPVTVQWKVGNVLSTRAFSTISTTGDNFALGNKPTGGNTLPIEMTSFTAVMQGTSALLNWTTATETNNAGFQIERSVEGSGVWVAVATVAGAGTSNSPKSYSYEDKNLAPGAYIYRIKQIDNDGTTTIYNPNNLPMVDAGVSNTLKLLGNYPNPFNPTTNIQFSVPQDGYASLKVYNMLGQEVATLFSGNAVAGHYIKVMFNASRYASGIYFARLQYNGKSLVQRMLMTK